MMSKLAKYMSFPTCVKGQSFQVLRQQLRKIRIRAVACHFTTVAMGVYAFNPFVLDGLDFLKSVLR